MSFQSKENSVTENKKDGLLNGIVAKYKECNENSYLQIAIHHLKVYENYLKIMEEKGPAAFPNKLEYQKFEIAKLFIDKINLLEFSLDPSFKGYKEYKDKRMPPLDAFNMTEDSKETKKINFLRSIEKGDVLHLRVVEESETEYKLLVINKYNENERVIDYLIHAFVLKSHHMNKLPRPLKIDDYIRAAVLGKLKMEGNVFSKLLVTLNNNMANEKYGGLKLGLIYKSEILYYPESIKEYGSFLNYMKTDQSVDNPQEVLKCMVSLGLDPYKIYNFDNSDDGKKLGKPKDMDSSTKEFKLMEMSMNKLKEAEKQIMQGIDLKNALVMIEEALAIYPQNDAAFAMQAQLWKSLFIQENDPEFVLKALNYCEKALAINPYNITASREYLTLLLLSASVYKEEKNYAKVDEINAIVQKFKPILDLSKLNIDDIEESNGQSSIEKSVIGVASMDLSHV